VATAVARRSRVLHLHYLATATRPGADSLFDRIRAGENFADLARAHSIDTRTSAAGGALDPVTWGTLPPALEEVAYALTPGALGGPSPTATAGTWCASIQSRRIRPRAIRSRPWSGRPCAMPFSRGQVASSPP